MVRNLVVSGKLLEVIGPQKQLKKDLGPVQQEDSLKFLPTPFELNKQTLVLLLVL